MRDLDQEPALVPADYGYNLAFGLQKALDPTYGRYVVNTVIFNYVTDAAGTKKRIKSRKPMNITLCEDKRFLGFNQTKVSMYGIPKMQCIYNEDEFQLQGDFYSEVFKYIEIRVQKCMNTTTRQNCRAEEEINDFFRHQSLSLAMINSYFDYSDFNHRDLKSI